MKNVLVIGSINVDYVIHTARIPKLGETVTGDSFSMNFGGKGANQATALAKVGCHVRMLGAVGNDSAGDLAVKNLESAGVNCQDVMKIPDVTTGTAVITVCGGDNQIILDAGANAHVTKDTVAARESLFDWADAVVMQYEIPTETVLFAAKLAKRHGCIVILNPAPVKEVDDELYRFVDWIVPNEFEAQMITGIPQENDADAERAVRALRVKGCQNAIVTLGVRGSAYFEGDAVRYGGIYPVRAVDTTAGDSFIGGFCAKLCEGATPTDAVRYAAAVSAIAVSRAGAAVSIPTADEVETFLKTHSEWKR